MASDGCIAPSAPAAAHYDHPHEKKRTAGAFRRHLPQRSSPAAALVAMLRAACALMLAAEKCTHTHTHKNTHGRREEGGGRRQEAGARREERVGRREGAFMGLEV